MNQLDKNKEDRAKLLGYLTPIITDYAENNRIEPDVCYEVCHELELVMIEKCKGKGMDTYELKKLVHIDLGKISNKYRSITTIIQNNFHK